MKNLVKKMLAWIGNVWVCPVTVCNVLFSFVCGARIVRYNDGVVELIASDVGPQSWFFRKYRFAAYTSGTSIVYRDVAIFSKPRIYRHEMRHVLQFRILGLLMLVLYPAASGLALIIGKSPYYDNLFEVDARKHEII